MDSSFVRKIEKAKDYAVQPNRVTFTQYKATFEGDNDSHEISYEDGTWKCTCPYFQRHTTCSHTMAMQMMLEGMVAGEAVGTA